MPHLRIETNVKSSDIKNMETCLAELTAAVAKTLSRPVESTFATVVTDVAMMKGDDSKVPVAQASLMSIGQLGVEENKKHAAVLFPLIKKHLGVDDDKCYIGFIGAVPSAVGYKGTTFHTIFGHLVIREHCITEILVSVGHII